MASKAFLQQAYLAYFGRPADPSGLAYYAEKTEAQVKAAFSASPESQAFFGSMEISAQINAIYQNLFNRDAEPAGLTYWAQEIGSGRLSLADAAMGILAGAQNDDKTAVANKLAASDAFTTALNTTAEMLGYAGSAAIAPARAFLKAVDATAASLTAATAGVDTSVNTVVNSAAASVAGQTFTLTTSVDAVSGTAGNDTIAGVLGNTPSFSVGDNIVGGAGTDTLNLIAAQHTANGLVSIDGVETVNVRLIGTAAETVELNAADWSGVAVLSNASSLSATTLEVSGVESTTNITLNGNTDVSVQYASTTTANAVGTIADAGTFAGATDIFASATANATAHLDFDLENTGLVSGISVTISGANNYARLEGGSNAEAYTVNGAGNATLVTDDLVVSFNAAAASGNLDVTFQAASEVVAVGGAGNDVFRFGTTLTNSDSVDGGAGTDTIRATLGAFSRTLTTTSVEAAVLTFADDAGGTVNATGSQAIASYTLAAGSAGADANVAGVAANATVALTAGADNLDDVFVGYASGAASGTVNIGSATGAVGLDILSVSGVASLALNAVAGSAGAAVSIASANFGGTNLAIVASGGEADLAISSLTADALQTLTITSNGSAGVTLTSGLEANTGLTSVTVIAQGSDAADVGLGGINNSGSSLAFNNLSLTASTGADITVGAVEMGNGATAASTGTITMVAGNGSDVGTTAMDVTTTGAMSLTLNLTAEASGDVRVGNVTMNAGTAATASTANLIINATIGAAGSVGVEAVNLDGSTAGGQITVAPVSVGTSAGFILFGGSGFNATNVANVDISAMTIVLGADASGSIASVSAASTTSTELGILTTGGAVGDITISVADSASAVVGNIFASAVGAINLSGDGDGVIRFQGVTGTDSIGTISVSAIGESDIDIGAISGSGTIGGISVYAGASATADFSTIDANRVQSIEVGGATGSWIDFGTISASAVGTVAATALASGGTFTIDLAGVDNAVEINLGAGTNTVISGKGNDVITLLGGRTAVAGNDTITFNVSANGTDNIINFIAGANASGGDVIRLDGDTLSILDGSGDQIGAAGSAGATAVSILAVTTNATSIGADDNIIAIRATAFASTAAMIAAVAVGGSLALTTNTDASAGGNLVIVWTDGTDSYVSLVGVTGATGLITANADVDTLAVIAGVTPGALVAANFDLL